jgi:hypothetical protein
MPVPKTGQTDLTQQKHPPKAKNAKEMHNLPLDCWYMFWGMQCNFSQPTFLPLVANA